MIKIMIDNEIFGVEELIKLSVVGKNCLVTEEGENALYFLLQMHEKITEAIEEIKEIVMKEALEIDENIKKIEGEKVSISFSYAGAKYKIINEEEIPAGLLKTTEKKTLDSKAVENYISELGSLPDGIEKADRKKTARVKIL